MRILFAHNRYRMQGGEDLAAQVEMELLRSFGHATELLEVDNKEIAGVGGTMKAALGTVYSRASKKRLEERIAAFQPDVVHVFNFFPLLSPSIHHACWEAGVPVIQKISNFRLICPGALLMREERVCEECLGKFFPWPGIRHACYRESRAGSAVVAAMIATHRLLGTWEKAVDGYIARTRFSRAKLVEGGLPAEKISIIPSFAPDPGPLQSSSGRFALFAGRLSPEKGISTMLDAWERLNGAGIRLKIAGEGPLKEEVQCRANGNGGNVEYLGALPRGQVQSLLGEAAFLVFPSTCYENFPLSIVEAFASGVPVVASGLGAMAEIIEHGRTGLLFSAGDVEDLTAKIEWAASHPAEMTKMRGEARAAYLSQYTPERNYELLISLYQRAIRARQTANA
ncbi:MAG TPA: glycosyltransferase family 4 protein [Terriglobales bacterium]|nr:glycosyltransferase family 4 protein [Terriglobales bacterium]